MDGLTQGHINQWRWNVNEKGWVNWPDYQTRIVQNNPKIKWTSKVHEVLTGFHKSYYLITPRGRMVFISSKRYKKTRNTNKYYDTL